jgi:Rha family phage regulatory protein
MKNQDLEIALKPEIVVIDGVLKTTSLKIAEQYGKYHHHVLRDIDDILTQVSDSFRKTNFGVSYYEQKNELGLIVKYRYYEITRDGFSLLVMGYTGEKAIKWKLAYIDAFNRMESELLKGHSRPTPAQIYLTVANDIRRSLPGLEITDQAVLISGNQGVTNLSGETREQLQYYKKMDEYGLPGIIAVDKKPYKVLFDWFNKHQHSEAVRESVYKALSDRCAWYKSMHPNYKPFQNRPACEEITGLKSMDECKEVATDMAKIVAERLSEKTNTRLLLGGA